MIVSGPAHIQSHPLNKQTKDKMGNEGGKLLDTTTPEGVQAMDESLQKKFSKGIQYNSKRGHQNSRVILSFLYYFLVKVLIRGDRNTGKSSLFKRMQGKAFSESYIPTNEIQVGHIQWTYPCGCGFVLWAWHLILCVPHDRYQ